MKDWTSTQGAAAALNSLNRALCSHHLDDADLDDIAEVVSELASRFTGTPRRDKLTDMQTRPHLAAIYAGQRTPLAIELGEQIEFDPFSIAGGEFHPASIGVTFHKESEESVVGRGVIDPMFAGPPERVHGGVQALIIDEVMGALNRMLGRQAFTARLIVNYRGPAPLGVPVTFRAWVERVEGRKITLGATGEGPDGLFVDADGLFVARRDDDPFPGTTTA